MGRTFFVREIVNKKKEKGPIIRGLYIGLRGDVKIQVLAIARFCKSLRTLARTGLPIL